MVAKYNTFLRNTLYNRNYVHNNLVIRALYTFTKRAYVFLGKLCPIVQPHFPEKNLREERVLL